LWSCWIKKTWKKYCKGLVFAFGSAIFNIGIQYSRKQTKAEVQQGLKCTSMQREKVRSQQGQQHTLHGMEHRSKPLLASNILMVGIASYSHGRRNGCRGGEFFSKKGCFLSF